MNYTEHENGFITVTFHPKELLTLVKLVTISERSRKERQEAEEKKRTENLKEAQEIVDKNL